MKNIIGPRGGFTSKGERTAGKMSAGGDGGVPMDPHAFELLSPSRFISFTFPNPSSSTRLYSHPLLRIAVLDSPSCRRRRRRRRIAVAAMLVPVGRENDWIFSTEAGHLQLLSSSSCSRLILVGHLPSQPPKQPYARPNSEPQQIQQFQDSILPLLLALSPASSLPSSPAQIPTIPFLSYHDDLARISPVDHLVGPVVGDMLVEDVEVDGGEMRRRLRFRRLPNLVQSQVRLVPDAPNLGMFRPQVGSLVQPYLAPMVAALSLSAPDLGRATRALCIGVGGGDLLMCLRHRFGFGVVGVEADEVVLSVAKQHFGLIEDDLLQIAVGDGIELIESRNVELSDGFDVIMVDLDSEDPLEGVSAPPLEFVRKSVLLGARSVLQERKGVMVVNVISPNQCFYQNLLDSLREVFAVLYEIDVGNGENCVLIAVASLDQLARDGNKGPLFDKLKEVGVLGFLDHMKKI